MAFPQSALMVKRSYLEINREKVASFVKALIEGLYLVKKDKGFGNTGDEKYIRADDEVYGIGYDYFLAKYGDDLAQSAGSKRTRICDRSNGEV